MSYTTIYDYFLLVASVPASPLPPTGASAGSAEAASVGASFSAGRADSEAHGRGLAPSPVHAPPPTARTLLSEALAAPTRVGSAMMDAVTDGLSRLKRHITLRCGWLGRIT